MLGYDDKQAFVELRQKFEETSKVFDLDTAQKKLEKLEKEMSESDFWNDPDKAAEVLKDAKVIRSLIDEIKKINH